MPKQNLQNSKTDMISVRDIDMRGRQTKNAADGTDPQDYVTLSQLTGEIAKLTPVTTQGFDKTQTQSTFTLPYVGVPGTYDQVTTDNEGRVIQGIRVEVVNTGPTTDSFSGSFQISGTPALYRIDYYIYCVLAGQGGTLTANFTWLDNIAVRSAISSNVFTSTYGPNGQTSGSFIVYNTGFQLINYLFNLVGPIGNPQYIGYATLTRLG